MYEEYFALLICVALPIICITIVKLNKNRSKVNNQETMDQLYYNIKDMKKRISNLETILYNREKRS